MSRRSTHLTLAVLAVFAFALPRVEAADAPLPHLGLDESLAAASVAVPALAAAVPWIADVPVVVRLTVRQGDVMRNGTLDMAPFDARLASYPAHVRAWLRLEDPPAATDAAALGAWRQLVRALVEHGHGRVLAVEVATRGDDDRATAFVLKVTAVQARAADPAVLIAIAGPDLATPARLQRLFSEDVAAYTDIVALDGNGPPPAIDAIRAIVDKADAATRIVLVGTPLGSERAAARRRMLESQVATLASAVALVTYGGDTGELSEALAGLKAVADLVGGELVPLDAGASALTITPAAGVDARLVYNLTNFSTYLLFTRPSGTEDIQVSLHLPSVGTPMVRSLAGTEVGPPKHVSHDTATQVVTVSVEAGPSPRLLDFNYGATAIYAQRDETRGDVQLTVQEIVARHQQVQAAEEDLVDTYIADARMEQHFRTGSFDGAGYDVVSDTRLYRDREGLEWEELSFFVNGTKWGSDRPPFPLLQPEKVLSLPLDLRLTTDYRYRLEGTDTVEGRRAYVVSFAPVDAARTLYKGRVWIDAASFTRLRLQTVQTKLSAPVVSNEETQEFAAVTTGGRDAWLPRRIDSKQILLIAGRNVLVEKAVVFRDYRIDDPSFGERRQSARGSQRIMFRETDKGLRYYVKENGQRVVSDKTTTKAKALAMGTTINPSFRFPLPIFGINYLNFGTKEKDPQLAVLFAGVLVLANVQRAHVLNGPLDASLDVFGIAVPSNDKVYVAGGERKDEALITWPETFGGNLGWQFTSFQKLTVNYLFRFDGYHADTTTSETFVLPASTITNGVGGGYEWKRAGYSLTASGMAFRRAGWRSWGIGGLETSRPSYAKYQASVSKDIFWSAFNKIHLNAAWFGGHDLDRFTQYQFGLFDETKIHGVPSSGIRFSQLGMLRGSYSFNVFEQYRVDLFLEHAMGRRDPRDPLAHITGIGSAFSLRGPWSTIVRGDVGKSFLPSAFSGNGSVVVQIMILKPL